MATGKNQLRTPAAAVVRTATMESAEWTALLARLRLDPCEWLSQLPPSLQQELIEQLPARPRTLAERATEAGAAIKAVVEVVDLVPKCWPEHRALAQPDPHLRLVCKLWQVNGSGRR